MGVDDVEGGVRQRQVVHVTADQLHAVHQAPCRKGGSRRVKCRRCAVECDDTPGRDRLGQVRGNGRRPAADVEQTHPGAQVGQEVGGGVGRGAVGVAGQDGGGVTVGVAVGGGHGREYRSGPVPGIPAPVRLPGDSGEGCHLVPGILVPVRLPQPGELSVRDLRRDPGAREAAGVGGLGPRYPGAWTSRGPQVPGLSAPYAAGPAPHRPCCPGRSPSAPQLVEPLRRTSPGAGLPSVGPIRCETSGRDISSQ